MGIGRVEAKPLLPKDWGAFSGALNELCLASFKRDNFLAKRKEMRPCPMDLSNDWDWDTRRQRAVKESLSE